MITSKQVGNQTVYAVSCDDCPSTLTAETRGGVESIERYIIQHDGNGRHFCRSCRARRPAVVQIPHPEHG